MARDGFVPNYKGYRAALNGGDAYRECDAAGARLCGRANAAGHGSYSYDTIHGKVRVHTRVKTADSKSFFRERKTHTLAHVAGRG